VGWICCNRGGFFGGEAGGRKKTGGRTGLFVRIPMSRGPGSKRQGGEKKRLGGTLGGWGFQGGREAPARLSSSGSPGSWPKPRRSGW